MDAQIPHDKLGIPPELARYADPKAPREARLLAAQGLVPAQPRVILAIQYCLVGDEDENVSEMAKKSLSEQPTALLKTVLDQDTHPKILEFFAFNRVDDGELLDHLLLLRQLSDRSFCFLAERVGPRHIEMIASNQERLLISPHILEHLRTNPRASKATLERVETFLRMYGLVAPDHSVSPHEDSEPAEPGTLEFEHGFESDEIEFAPELTDDNETPLSSKEKDETTGEEEKKGDLWSQVTRMKVSQKIKLAFFGNAMVRAILVRDSNKMVATCVMKNPRISDKEVVTFAKSRNVCNDVLREICRNKEWVKKYPVKLALVNNPKTPPAVAVRLVNQLMLHDIKMLARNKNVSSVVQTTAKVALRKRQ